MSGKQGRASSTKERGFATSLAIPFFLLILQFMNCGPALAQDGGTAACVCYCGIHLSPPCGDDACKRACGWKEPTTGGNTPAGAAAGAIGSAISSGITRAFDQARARAEQERQDNLRALQENQKMLRSLDGMSRERVRTGDEMLQHSAEQARQLDNQRRDETLMTLQGIPQSDELTLIPATDFFGIPGNPKSDSSSLIDSSVVDLRHLDPGKPITVDNNVLRENPRDTKKEKAGFSTADCEKRKSARDRLAAGLPVQLEAIRRTEAQLEAAKKGVGEASVEKRQVLLQGAIQEAKEYAKDVLTSAEALRSQVALLKELDVNKAERDVLIRSLDTIIFEGESLAQASRAGYESGEELRSKVDKLSKQILPLADKLLMQSGIAEKVGEELAGKLGGPLGALGFRGARLSIDFTVALGKGVISETEREAAQRNLDTMRGQHQRAKQRISELDRDLVEGCKDRLQAHQ
jgi:hypothetical protein